MKALCITQCLKDKCLMVAGMLEKKSINAIHYTKHNVHIYDEILFY